jgi:hypothetical protein
MGSMGRASRSRRGMLNYSRLGIAIVLCGRQLQNLYGVVRSQNNVGRIID